MQDVTIQEVNNALETAYALNGWWAEVASTGLTMLKEEMEHIEKLDANGFESPYETRAQWRRNWNKVFNQKWSVLQNTLRCAVAGISTPTGCVLNAYLSPAEAAAKAQTSVQAVRDVLRDDERRAAIFPGAYRTSDHPQRGEWRIPRAEVEAWKPRRVNNN